MQKADAAAFLASLGRNEASSSTNIHFITGEVENDSSDGIARISVDGLVFSEEDNQYVEMSTIGGLEEGDVASILLIGEEGKQMTPFALGSAGSVDKIRDHLDIVDAVAATADALAQQAKAIAAALNQYFWHDSSGVHITEVPEEDWNDSENPDTYHKGANVLITAIGQLFRFDENPLLGLLGGNTPGLSIYNGNGDSVSDLVAYFAENIIELGKNSVNSIISLCGEKATISYTARQGTSVGSLNILGEDGISLESILFSLDGHSTYVRNNAELSGTFLNDDVVEGNIGFRSEHVSENNGSSVGMMGVTSGYYDTIVNSWYPSEAYISADQIVLDSSKYNLAMETYPMIFLDRILSTVKTAGDSVALGGYRDCGYITSGRTVFQFTIKTGYYLYNVSGVTLNGTYTIRQNGAYLFGSTANAGYAFTGHYTASIVDAEKGWIAVTINTGAEQTSAVNNDPAAIVINSCTATFT